MRISQFPAKRKYCSVFGHASIRYQVLYLIFCNFIYLPIHFISCSEFKRRFLQLTKTFKPLQMFEDILESPSQMSRGIFSITVTVQGYTGVLVFAALLPEE